MSRVPYQRARMYLLPFLFGVALLVASCGSGFTGATTTSRPTVPAPTPVPTLSRITVLTPPNCMPVASGAFPTGTYQAQVNSSENLFLMPNGEFDLKIETACYFVMQQKILFVDPTACSDTSTQHGAYNWAFDGSALRFTVVHDTCFRRQNHLVGGGQQFWIKGTP